MARDPRDQQKTDAMRIPDGGTGKLDEASASAEAAATPLEPEGGLANPAEVRARLEREREAAITRLRDLGISPETEASAPRGAADVVRDEGDQAQASERQDIGFMTRERLARRISRLTAALERLHRGDYGRCAVCGEAIEPARLAALPEAGTCRRCQERLEREQAA